MSSSAFTPSTTTVTNNVPVNVPVVTAWESYTPVVTNLISFAGNQYGRYRRVGDSMEVFAHINATGSSSNIITVSIPSGFTIDLTKIPTGGVQTVGTVKALRNGVSIYEGSVETNGTTQVKFYLADSTPQAAGSTTPWTWQSGDHISFYCTVPIAEWSGSGTTTLATKAVEEYAYNTNTSNTSNTSAFANGPDGVLFPQITTFGVSVNKRVRFQTSILPTDAIILEYQQAGSGSWRTMSQRLPIIQQGANGYGVDIVNVSGSTTDIDIGFREGGAVTNGATYGANGEAWNAYYLAGWKWRVRKVSSGAQVGYPVSARNIVGDTSGTVVPTGMLGEKQEVLQTSLANCGAANQFKDFGSITLGAGVWSLNFVCMFSQSGSNVSVCLAGIGTVSGNSGTGQVQGENAFFALPPTSATDNTISIPNYIISLSSSTTFYGKVYATYSSGTPQYRGRLTAIRIA